MKPNPVAVVNIAMLLKDHSDPAVRDLAEAAIALAKQAAATRDFLLLAQEVHGPQRVEALSFGHRPSAQALRKLIDLVIGESE